MSGITVEVGTRQPIDVEIGTRQPVEVEIGTRQPIEVDVGTKQPINVDVVRTGAQGVPGAPGVKGDKGDKGDPGEVVGSIPDKNLVYPFTVQSELNIMHNLGKYPAVTIFDSAGDEVEADVIYTSMNAVRIEFSAPFSGVVVFN